MKTHVRAGHRRGGFTIVEMTVATLIFVLLLGTLGVVATSGQSAYKSTVVTFELDGKGRRALARIADELASINGLNFSPNPVDPVVADHIDFEQSLGVVNGAATWTPMSHIGFEYEPGEANDGQDNDGDGLVDEGLVVFIRDDGGPNELRAVLCRSVPESAPGEIPGNGVDDNGNGVADERGFNIDRVGDVLTLRLWVELPGSGGETVVRQNQASVRLRNLEQL